MGNQCCGVHDPATLKVKLETYKKIFDSKKINSLKYQKDIEEKEKYNSDYKAYISELNYQLSNIKEQLNISYANKAINQNIINTEEKNNLLNDLEDITNKINEFHNLLENQKTTLKNLENNFSMIQEQFNDIDEKFLKRENVSHKLVENKISTLEKLLEENQELLNKLEDNQRLSDQRQTNIENEIKKMQKITEDKLTKITTEGKDFFEKIYSNQNKSYDLKGSINLNSSMLLGIKDFSLVKKQLKTIYLFREKENLENKYKGPILINKNWHEICYINNEFDLHDITYELKAAGPPNDGTFTSGTYIFEPDVSIDIILFEIDFKQCNDYKHEKHFLHFNIHLKNLESSIIHIKYKESPKKMKLLKEEEEAFRNIHRSKIYGLSEILAGQSAKYILKNESNFEIINFEDEFFIRTNDNEYQWGAQVPKEGKKTRVRMTKKEGVVNYFENVKIRTEDNKSIKNSNLKYPFSYFDGNNETIKSEYIITPRGEINLDNNKKIYDIKFINLNTNIAEFTLKGELMNKCKTDWVINLTNEEIDSLVPEDFKENKFFFNKIAKDIIKDYDAEHKNDVIIVPEMVKIGKWVKNNIKYDLRYAHMNKITAKQTYDNRGGVCDHITKLYNALMYSLGYPVLYAFGFAMINSNKFGINDSHAWSLINVDKKLTRWLPFDATWGIFSGKLPVTHIYKKIGYKGPSLPFDDEADIVDFNVQGNIK